MSPTIPIPGRVIITSVDAPFALLDSFLLRDRTMTTLLILGLNWALDELKLRSNSSCDAATSTLTTATGIKSDCQILRFLLGFGNSA